jgi:hypothetical protein
LNFACLIVYNISVVYLLYVTNIVAYSRNRNIKPKGLVVYVNTMLEVKPLTIRTKTLVNILQPIVEKVCMISTVRTEVLAMVYIACWSY